MIDCYGCVFCDCFSSTIKSLHGIVWQEITTPCQAKPLCVSNSFEIRFNLQISPSKATLASCHCQKWNWWSIRCSLTKIDFCMCIFHRDDWAFLHGGIVAEIIIETCTSFALIVDHSIYSVRATIQICTTTNDDDSNSDNVDRVLSPHFYIPCILQHSSSYFVGKKNCSQFCRMLLWLELLLFSFVSLSSSCFFFVNFYVVLFSFASFYSLTIFLLIFYVCELWGFLAMHIIINTCEWIRTQRQTDTRKKV